MVTEVIVTNGTYPTITKPTGILKERGGVKCIYQAALDKSCQKEHFMVFNFQKVWPEENPLR